MNQHMGDHVQREDTWFPLDACSSLQIIESLHAEISK